MARIAVFIDHDIVARHFVLNGILAPLWSEHEVVFVLPENQRRVRLDPERLPIPRYRTVPVPDARTHRYRRLYHATLLRNFRHGPDRRVLTRLWRDILGPKAFVRSWLCSHPLTHPLYRAAMLARIGDNEALDRVLAEERPDVIVHPTVLEGLFVSDLVRWGARQGVPTVFIANSWDNASTRVMLAGHPDRLVVWGPQAQQDAIEHMQVPAERIVCLGAAQFDLYRRAPRTVPAEYRRQLGVPEGVKLLLYAGSSKGLNETRHLLELERAVEEGVLKDCAVVYRPHPWRGAPAGEQDFFSLTWKHVMLDPAMQASYRRSRSEQGIDVELADYEDTHVTLSAADAVISPLSTILLEAALHGKPVAVYLPDEDMAGNKFMYAVAQMRFFKDFFERVDPIQCTSPARLVEDCRALLERCDEPGIAATMKERCAYFVEPADRPYGERLREIIADTIRSRQGAIHAAL